mmetsp:Transcript_569/g.1516  ORF Transcript_569/g.1516 Transcript_569/m.1516 type:complete len:339 (+) Transcript_569:1423-2439(+)
MEFMHPCRWGALFVDSVRVLDMAFFHCPVCRLRVIGFHGAASWPQMTDAPTTPRALRVFDSCSLPGELVGLSCEPGGPIRSLDCPSPQPRSAGRPFVHYRTHGGELKCTVCPIRELLALMTFPPECEHASCTADVVRALGGRGGVAHERPWRRMLERSCPPAFMACFIRHAIPSVPVVCAHREVVLHFVDGFSGFGGPSIGAFMVHAHSVRFYALDISREALVVYRQVLIAAGVNAAYITCVQVDMTSVCAYDVKALLDPHVAHGDITWLHLSPPCDQIARIHTNGNAEERARRRREGMWVSYKAAKLFESCQQYRVSNYATFENVCSLIPGRHKPYK